MDARCGIVMSSLALLLAACGDHGPASGDGSQPGKASDNHKAKIALILKPLSNPFFVAMQKGAERAQQEAGIDLVVRATSGETAIEQQLTLVEDEIRDHVDAIVIAPVDSRRLVPVLKKAQDAGIRIINVDNRLDADTMKARGMAQVPFISIDNEQAAYRSAKYVADQAKTPQEAGIFEGIRHADNANRRKHGAERAFADNPNLKLILEETANWNTDEAYAIAKRVFPAHPNLDVVFCANDMMAFGVIKYLKEAGRHDVRIASFDALEDAKRAIRAGDLVVTVDQQADKQGYEGIMAALKVVRGQAVPGEIQLDAALVTAESLKQP